MGLLTFRVSILRDIKACILLSNRVFDGVAQVQENLVRIVFRLLSIDADQMLSILCLNCAQEVAVLLQSTLDDRVSVLALLDKTSLCFIWNLIKQQIVMLQFNWIEASLLNLLVDRGVTLIKSDDEGWNYAQIVESSYLFVGCRATI